MPDYKNAKIYKIVCNTTGMVYVGSTTQSLSMRLAGHRGHFKRFKDGKGIKITSFQVLAQGNYDIVLIETCSCESKDELHRRERFYIESLDCINNNIPTRTKKEYNEANKDTIKQYRDANKDTILKYHKQHYEANKERIAEIRKQHYEANKERLLEKDKQHYEANKERIAERHKQYRYNNKDIIAEKDKQRRAKKLEL